MKKTEFFEALVDILEVDMDMDASTPLAELDEYDSLAIMGLISYIDENFDKTVSGQKLSNANTVKDLMDIIGQKHFDD